MSLQFGSNKIGGVQYGGVTIGEAMMNGQIVYSSAPPVDPYTLGAVSWLPLNGDFSDHGTNPVTWNPEMGTVIWGDGYLKQLGAQPGWATWGTGFAFNPTVGATIAAWVYIPSTGGTNVQNTFIEATASFSEIKLAVTRTSSTQCILHSTYRRGATGAVSRQLSGTYPTNTWLHLVSTMAPTAPGSTTWAVRAYVNGESKLSANQAMGSPQAVNFNGARVTAGSQGWIDDASFYNRALAPEEITALYSAGPN